MSTGIQTVNSGPLFIRTYNDESVNNTFLLTRYDYPVSTNYALITATDGRLAPSDKIVQPRMGMSSFASDQTIGNRINFTIIGTSTLMMPVYTFSTFTVESLTPCTVLASTSAFGSIRVSTINISTFSPCIAVIQSTTMGSTLLGSTFSFYHLTTSSMNVEIVGSNISSLVGSTIYGNIIQTSNFNGSSVQASTTTITTMVISTVTLSSITVNTALVTFTTASSMTANSIDANTLNSDMSFTTFLSFSTTLYGSTINLTRLDHSVGAYDRITISTLTVPRINDNFNSFSTVQYSTLTAPNVNGSTITASTITAPILRGSTVQLSTLTAPSALFNVVSYSTLQQSTTILSSMTVSSLTTSTAMYSTLYGSSLITCVLSLPSTVTGSTLSFTNISISTLRGAVFTTSTLTASTMLTSSVIGQFIQGSTIRVSTVNGGTVNASAVAGSTIQGGMMFYSTITASSVSIAAVTYSTLQQSTITLSTLIVSSANIGAVGYSSLSGGSLNGNLATSLSTMTGSTISFNTMFFSTLQGTTFTPSTLNASTVQVTALLGSTLQGSTIRVPLINGSSINAGAITGSTIQASSVLFSTLITSSVTLPLLSYSTLQGSTLALYGLTGSTIMAGMMVYPVIGGEALTDNVMTASTTITGSTISFRNMSFTPLIVSSASISTLTASSILVNPILFSTLQGSTISLPLINGSTVHAGNITGSTIQANSIVFSTLVVPAITLSVFDFSTLQGSTLTLSSLYASTVTIGTDSFSTLSGDSIVANGISIASTVIGSTIGVTNMSFSTIRMNTLSNSTFIASTVQCNALSSSTLQGSAILTSTLDGYTFTTTILHGSTIGGGTVLFSTLTASSVNVLSLSYSSSFQGSTLHISSSIAMSSLYTSTASHSTLNGVDVTSILLQASTLQSNNITLTNALTASSFTLSTLTSYDIKVGNLSTVMMDGDHADMSSISCSYVTNANNINFSTLRGSTLNTNVATVFSSLLTDTLSLQGIIISTIQTSSIVTGSATVFSTLTASTLHRYHPVVYSSTLTAPVVICSSITTQTINVRRSIVNHPVNGRTSKKNSIINTAPVLLKTSGIIAKLDAPPSYQQIYTFGPSIPNRWVVTCNITNTLGYSNDGINWVGLGPTVLGVGRIAVWNGTMWVAVGDIISVMPQLSGITSNSWTTNGITWTTSTSSTYLTAFPYYAFNNNNASGSTTCATNGEYTGTPGLPTGVSVTNIQTIGNTSGAWLQLQSSVPVTITSFLSSCGGTVSYQMRTYFIVGSNDGSTWYPIQSGSFSANPYTTTYTSWTGYATVNLSGTQTITGQTAVTLTTVTYPTTTNQYTYFRFIGTSVFGGTIMEFGELYINFLQNTTIAYSYDGIKWTGTGGSSIFTSYGLEVAWNGIMWVAAGGGTNSLAYSYDGINWTGLGTGVFSVYSHAIGWNGRVWVAVGVGTNTIAYSYNGLNWTGAGISIFTNGSFGVAWNGTMWIAVGDGTNTIAYSYDGITWVGVTNTIFTVGVGVAWNGIMWVVIGTGASHSIAYSYDGIAWTGVGKSIVTTGRKLAWNGTIWVLTGSGNNTIAYSYNGIDWIGVGNVLTTSTGMAVSFNSARPHTITFPASMLVATGSGTNTLATSYDGVSWTGLGQAIFSKGYGCAWNGSMWVAVGEGSNTIAYSTPDIETPYLYLPFENASYADVMGNSTITAYGSPTFVTGPAGSTALKLTNTAGSTALQYLQGPCTLGSNFTISFWFYLNTLPAIDATSSNIITLGGTSTVSVQITYLTLAGGYTGFYVQYYNAANIASSVAGAVSVSTGIWYQCTVTFQALGTCSVYLNNALVGTQPGAGLSTSITTMRIGSTLTSATNAMNGLIDDVKIYNYSVPMNAPVRWKGLGTSVFSSQGSAVAWGGNIWVAVGSGTNTIAYSYDGITWIGLGSSIFTIYGNGITWNGNMWVAVGSGSNCIAYSYNGINWIGIGHNIFSIQGSNVAWNGSMWIAVGAGTNSIAYSYNGINWTGLGTNAPIFASIGYGIAWNGTIWVAVGTGSNTILYSKDGINWAAANSCFTESGTSVTWNGGKWIATGTGTNTIGYSYDGINWTGSLWIGHMWPGTSWNGGIVVSPQQTSLSSNTWTQGNITWTASASSILNASYPAYGAFNNYSGSNFVYSWATPVYYRISDGAYIRATPVTTTIEDIGEITGEWLQIQSSTPAVMHSYTYGCGAYGQFPKTYYIVGSDDGTTWYPIQSCVMTANPLNANFTACSTYITVNQSGIQTITGGVVGSGTFTTYSYTTQAFTYFRLIGQTLWSGTGNNGNMEAGDWYINFRSPLVSTISNIFVYTYTMYGGASIASSGYRTNSSALSLVAASSQYVKTSNFTSTTNGLTIAFWYKSNASGTWGRIFDFGNGAGVDNIGCSPNANDGVGVNRFGFFCPPGGNFYLSDINYNDNVWRHVTWTLTYAATGSGTSVWNIYLNGVFKATTTNYYPSTTATRSLCYIGKSNWDDGYFNGLIDNFRVYHRTLTANDVATLYSTFGMDTVFSDQGTSVAWNGGIGNVTIQHPVIAVGQGTNTLAYSPDGVQWSGLGKSIFSTAGYGVAWNGTRWVAVGSGTNTIAYSTDGLRWLGSGTSIFSTQGNGVAWNGSLWVAVGSGTNSVAYSTNGIDWLPSASGTAIFTTSANHVAWNGSLWVAVGQGTNSIAYSANGITWTASSSTVFSTKGNDVTWTGSLWIAVGSGTNTIAYSSDGLTWTAVTSSPFSTSGNGVTWNGTRWVAVGQGTNTIAYSANGTIWTGFGTSLFSTAGYSVTWTGSRFVAVGTGTNSIIYSQDGITWYIPTNGIFTQGNGVAGNSLIGANVCDSQIVMSGSSNILDIVSDSYYNTGYNNFSATIQTYNTAYLENTIPGPPTGASMALYPSGAPTGINVFFTPTTNLGSGVDTYYAIATDPLGAQTTVTASSATSPVYLSGLIPATTYQISVYSYNAAGLSTATSAGTPLMYQILPGAPTSTAAALAPAGNPTGALVSFTAPTNPGGVSSYTATAYSGTTPISSASGAASPLTVTGLTAGTSYTFSVTLTNSIGTGPVSNVASLVYKTQPGAPTAVSGALYPSGAPTGINVSFTVPSNLGGGVDLYYASAVDALGVQTTVTVSSATSPVYLSGLVAGTTYQISVYSYNAGGQSTATSGSNLLYQTVPGAPTSATAALTPAGNPTGVLVSFTAPSNLGGGVSSYTATAYSGATPISSATGAASPLTITGLTAGTSYTYSVKATNSGGTSAASNAPTLVYKTQPGAPTAVSGALHPSGDPTGINVSFTAPSNLGGGVDLYYASATDTLGVQTTVTASSATSPVYLTGLVAGTTYQFTVYSYNAGGQSEGTISDSALLYQTLPGAPTSTTAALTPTGNPTGVLVSFTAPSNLGGGVSSYTATAYSGATPISSATGAASPLTITGLTAGTSYTYSVKATNTGGTGAASNVVTLVYKTQPGAPTAVSGALHPVGAPTGINVSFTPPSNLGGGVDLYYASAVDILGVQTTVTASSATSPVYLTGLVNGTTYQFAVYSYNAGGQSSATSSGSNLLYQIGSVPGAPTAASAALTPAGNPTGVLVSFTAPSNLGGGVSSYTATAYSGATPISSASGAASPLTITGLTAGISYTFSVIATNSYGNSPASNVPTLVYRTLPSAPSQVFGARYPSYSSPTGTNTGIAVYFNLASNLGGDTVLYYVSTIDTAGVQPTVTVSTATSPVVISGLVDRTTYQFTVYSSNTVGQSTATLSNYNVLYLIEPRVHRVRYEGTNATSGAVGSPNIVIGMTFYELEPDWIYIYIENNPVLSYGARGICNSDTLLADFYTGSTVEVPFKVGRDAPYYYDWTPYISPQTNLPNLIRNGSYDDDYVDIGVPWNVTFLGVSYSNVYLGSNTYLTFGSGSVNYYGLSASNPYIPKILLGSADNSYQRVYTGTSTQ